MHNKVCIIAVHSKHRNCIICYTYIVEANCIKQERERHLGKELYKNELYYYKCIARLYFNLNLYKTRKRERQKRLDNEYTIESNCIKREREKLDTI